jgi:hypothetical protein
MLDAEDRQVFRPEQRDGGVDIFDGVIERLRRLGIRLEEFFLHIND